MTFEKALAITESLKDKIGDPVDNKIKNLVAAMIMMGVKTLSLCEGHKNWGLPYPWIEFDREDILLVNRILSHQNAGKRNRNRWVILPHSTPRIVPWNTKKSLRTLQKDASRFAAFMQFLYVPRSAR